MQSCALRLSMAPECTVHLSAWHSRGPRSEPTLSSAPVSSELSGYRLASRIFRVVGAQIGLARGSHLSQSRVYNRLAEGSVSDEIKGSIRSKPLRELFAELEHEQWLEWSRELAASEDVSEERLARWRPRWVDYWELSEADKDLDRAYADRILAVLDQFSAAP